MQELMIGIDDTDSIGYDLGTGKLARWMAAELCEHFSELTAAGVIRHQLLKADGIPYTSHNSPACIILNAAAPLSAGRLREVRQFSVDYIQARACPTSAPGLCIAATNAVSIKVMDFGERTAWTVMTQSQALATAAEAGLLLERLGGNGQGIIGALAAVGLTAHGEAGRYLEYRTSLRKFPNPVPVKALQDAGISVHSNDIQAEIIPNDAVIHTHGWLRPRLRCGKPCLTVIKVDEKWVCADNNKKERQEEVKQW